MKENDDTVANKFFVMFGRLEPLIAGNWQRMIIFIRYYRWEVNWLTPYTNYDIVAICYKNKQVEEGEFWWMLLGKRVTTADAYEKFYERI